MTSARTSSTSGRIWCVLVGSWSLIFAVPHFHRALGGRADLGVEAAATDAALQRTWFSAYNSLPEPALALALLGANLLGGVDDDLPPMVLLAIEPWFLLGGLAYGGTALTQRESLSEEP